jgi:hypothetical protein
MVRFWWHAIRSMRQAQRAPGIVSVDARIIRSVHHTVTVWVDQTAMRRYLVSGAHLQAMKSFHSIATGGTLGFEAEQAPAWNEAHDLWLKQAKPVGPPKPLSTPEVA